MWSNRMTLLVAGLAMTAIGMGSLEAASTDYKFQVIRAPLRVGELLIFSVRLIRIADGSPVTDAEITPQEFNMSPEGMSHSNPFEVKKSPDPGVLVIELEPEMAGRWALVLKARVPGEDQEINGTLTVTVPK